MIPLDFTSTTRLSPDEKSLPSPHKATTDNNEPTMTTMFNDFTQSTPATATHSEQLQSSTSSSLIHRTLLPRRHTRRQCRRGGPATSSSVHRVTSQQRRRQEQRRHSVDTAASHVTPDLPQSVECCTSMPDDDDVEQQECQPAAAQRVIPVVDSSPSVISSPLHDNSPAAARRTARTPAINTHPLPADPRQWSRDDVHAWLREMSLKFNMAAIDTCKFPFNGKALCLCIMNPTIFLSRVPCGGKRLFREFQCRLSRAVHMSAGAL